MSQSQIENEDPQQYKQLLLLDIDGVLTLPKQKITQSMSEVLQKALKYFDLAIISGSNETQLFTQLGQSVQIFKHRFYENGNHYYKKQALQYQKSMKEFLGEYLIKKLLDFSIKQINTLMSPQNDIEFYEMWNSMINLIPSGHGCSQQKWKEFMELNKQKNILNKLQCLILEEFWEFVMVSQGGQISLDIYPIGWDKSQCLQILLPLYEDVYFFGDKCEPGENDYPIYKDNRVKSFFVKEGPNQTINLIEELIQRKENK